MLGFIDVLELVLDVTVDFAVELDDLTVEIENFRAELEDVDLRVEVVDLSVAELNGVILLVEIVVLEATDVGFRVEVTLVRIEVLLDFDVLILEEATMPKFTTVCL